MHLLLRVNAMLDFNCTGSDELQGTRNKQKFQNAKKISLIEEFECMSLFLRSYRLINMISDEL